VKRDAGWSKTAPKKLPLIKAEINPPSLCGSDTPDAVIVGWGSTYGVMKEAVDRLSAHNIAMLHFSELYPFQTPQNLITSLSFGTRN
jgi:2-oxoglutarate ferredoxin oxidoreductase subunit alpha